MGPHRARGWHFSLKDTEHEDSSPAAPTGDPLSTASDGPDRRPANAEGITVIASGPSIAPRPVIRAGPVTGSRPSIGSGPVIAVDAMGGDHAPDEIVAGALAAQREHGIRVLLTGPAARLRQALAGLGADADSDELRVVPAEENLGMHEGALASLRRPRSSVAVACQLVRQGDAAAVVSAGSTGGIVAIARLRLRSLPGVLRPGLAVVLPTRPGRTVLIDAGATADPKPEMLVQFGQLGVAYAQLAFGVPAPRVGLLTIGAEPGKGNKFTRRAHELLAADPPRGALPLSFAGNVEGGDLLAGEVDVIVTDGFTGNVALKTLEGSIRFASAELRAAVTGTRAARLGAILQRRPLRELAARLDAESYGGAVLLGLGGTVVIAHGASTARAVTSACLLAADLARGQITEKITQRLGPGRGGHFLRRPLPVLRSPCRRSCRRSSAAPAAGPAAGPPQGLPPVLRRPFSFDSTDRLGAWPIRRRFSRSGCATPSSRRSALPTTMPTR
jgi:phosphate acyltransferase